MITATPAVRSIHTVDAFADSKHKGNPAGVCYGVGYLDSREMQDIAMRSKMPVTAFIDPLQEDHFSIRWFTANCELNLCGHGTMASAYWLYQEFGVKQMYFHSKSGLLFCKITDNGQIEMDFPALRTSACDDNKKTELEQALNIPIESCYFDYEDYLVELKSGNDVVCFEPMFSRLNKVDCRGIIITAWDEQFGYDCVSRFFAPRIAINEDQVCVSAHCKILPYWQKKKQQHHLHAWQASDNGGELHLYALNDNKVRIQGNAKLNKKITLTELMSEEL